MTHDKKNLCTFLVFAIHVHTTNSTQMKTKNNEWSEKTRLIKIFLIKSRAIQIQTEFNPQTYNLT